MTSLEQQIEDKILKSRKKFYESFDVDSVKMKVHEKINQIIDEETNHEKNLCRN